MPSHAYITTSAPSGLNSLHCCCWQYHLHYGKGRRRYRCPKSLPWTIRWQWSWLQWWWSCYWSSVYWLMYYWVQLDCIMKTDRTNCSPSSKTGSAITATVLLLLVASPCFAQEQAVVAPAVSSFGGLSYRFLYDHRRDHTWAAGSGLFCCSS